MVGRYKSAKSLRLFCEQKKSSNIPKCILGSSYRFITNILCVYLNIDDHEKQTFRY